MSYWTLKRVTMDIELKSTAHATLLWFLYGVNPYFITVAAYGEVSCCLPKPFMPAFFGEASFSRNGVFSGRSSDLKVRR